MAKLVRAQNPTLSKPISGFTRVFLKRWPAFLMPLPCIAPELLVTHSLLLGIPTVAATCVLFPLTSKFVRSRPTLALPLTDTNAVKEDQQRLSKLTTSLQALPDASLAKATLISQARQLTWSIFQHRKALESLTKEMHDTMELECSHRRLYNALTTLKVDEHSDPTIAQSNEWHLNHIKLLRRAGAARPQLPALDEPCCSYVAKSRKPLDWETPSTYTTAASRKTRLAAAQAGLEAFEQTQPVYPSIVIEITPREEALIAKRAILFTAIEDHKQAIASAIQTIDELQETVSSVAFTLETSRLTRDVASLASRSNSAVRDPHKEAAAKQSLSDATDMLKEYSTHYRELS